MITVLGLEHPRLEHRNDINPEVGRYGFDLSPQYVGNERISVVVFRASQCRGLSAEPPAWFGVEETPVGAQGPQWFSNLEDDDDRPEGAPLHITETFTYLEPRYDAYVAFVVEMPEIEED